MKKKNLEKLTKKELLDDFVKYRNEMANVYYKRSTYRKIILPYLEVNDNYMETSKYKIEITFKDRLSKDFKQDFPTKYQAMKNKFYTYTHSVYIKPNIPTPDPEYVDKEEFDKLPFEKKIELFKECDDRYNELKDLVEEYRVALAKKCTSKGVKIGDYRVKVCATKSLDFDKYADNNEDEYINMLDNDYVISYRYINITKK